MACKNSLIVDIACCGTQIILRAGLAPNTSYFWTIKSERTNNLYQKTVTTNPFGDLVISLDDLPDGLIHQYAGLFELKVKEGANYLNTIKMLLLGEEMESVFFQCIPINNPVALNSTISTEAILNNPNNSNTSGYTKVSLAVNTNGQTTFAIPQLLQNFLETFLFINGQERNYGLHYNIVGTNLSWLSQDYTLETTDEVVFYYKN
jgi:hypothetical protein